MDIKIKKKEGCLKTTLIPKMATCHPDRPIQARGLCKSCYNKWLILHNPDYAEKQKQNNKNWVINNKQRVVNYKKEYANNIKPDTKKNRSLVNNFGITLDDYNYLLTKQNNKCAICKKDVSEFKNKLAVDHDHNTGEIRGLLCFRCNFGLSYFSENPETLENAANYLKNGSITHKDLIGYIESKPISKEMDYIENAEIIKLIIPDDLMNEIYQKHCNGQSFLSLSHEYNWLCSRKVLTDRIKRYAERVKTNNG
jgi:hypothetical protein